MGWFLLALLSAVGFGISGFLIKLATLRSPTGNNYILLGLYISAFAAFTAFALFNGTFVFPLGVLALGLSMGAGTAVGNTFFVRALNVGPASLTAPLVNANVVLVIVMSIIFFDERLNTTEVIGIVLLIVAVSLLSVDPNESISISDRIWYGLVAAAIAAFFLRVGGLKLADEFTLPSTPILVLNYAVGLVWFGRAVFAQRTQEPPPRAWQGFGFAFAAGAFSFVGLQSYALALVDGPASIVAPIFAANGLVIAILTITILREKLSMLQVVALAGIISGLVILRI